MISTFYKHAYSSILMTVLSLAPIIVYADITSVTPSDLSNSNPDVSKAKETTIEFSDGLNDYNEIQDTYVSSGRVYKNWGNSSNLLVDGNDRSRGELVALMKWDISSIPTSSVVLEANVTLTVFNRSKGTYKLYAMDANWSETSLNWRNANIPMNQGVEIATFYPSSKGTHKVLFNSAGIVMVQSWIANSKANYGFLIRSAGTRDGVDFRSSEYSTQSQRPKLTITYQ